jgi:hypothetical protein
MRKVTARARSEWSDRSQAFRSRRAGALAVERRRTASRVAKLERQAFVRRAASPRIILLWNGVWFSIPGAIRSMKSFEAMDWRDGDHRLLPSVDRASCLAAQPVAVVDTDFLRGIQLVWNALELGCRPSAPSRLCRYRGRYFDPRQRLLVGASAMAVAVPRTVSRAFLPRALTGRYTGSGGTCRDRSWRRHFFGGLYFGAAAFFWMGAIRLVFALPRAMLRQQRLPYRSRGCPGRRFQPQRAMACADAVLPGRELASQSSCAAGPGAAGMELAAAGCRLSRDLPAAESRPRNRGSAHTAGLNPPDATPIPIARRDSLCSRWSAFTLARQISASLSGRRFSGCTSPSKR